MFSVRRCAVTVEYQESKKENPNWLSISALLCNLGKDSICPASAYLVMFADGLVAVLVGLAGLTPPKSVLLSTLRNLEH